MKQWTAEHWDRVSPYLDQALDLSTAERELWLAGLSDSGSDPALVDELRELLAQHEANSVSQFLEQSPLNREEEDKSQAGQSIGAYTLETLLGRGGMGSVWRAQRSDGHFEGRVAIKILDRRSLGLKATEQIRHEASLLARLSHPNIGRLFDAGFQPDGRPFLILEYIEGERIDHYCRQLTLAARLRLFLPVLEAVAHAHAQHIVHRDLKPSNILVTQEGVAKLLDFGVASLQLPASPGIASAAAEQEPLGMTLGYAAPEQIRGDAASPASDVYALGILLYVLLTDRHPYGADSSPTLLAQAMLTADFKPASESIGTVAARRWVRGEMDSIIAKATHREAALRYANAGQLALDIQQFLEGRPLQAQRRSLRYRASLFLRRIAGWLPGVSMAQRRLRVAVLAIVALLLAATGAALWQSAWNNGHRSMAAVTLGSSPPTNQRSIAVLPFVDMSAMHDQEYFSDGLSEELIDRLAHSKDLKVIARTSSFQFKGKNEDIRLIGQRLGVGNVLEGSVRQSGNTIRVTAQLINVTDGVHRWSQSYDRSASDVFKIQDEITSAVVAALEATLGVKSQASNQDIPDPNAYSLYLQGRQLLHNERSQAELKNIEQLLRKAVSIDPGLVEGWHYLLGALSNEITDGYVRPEAVEGEIRSIARKIQELSPDSSVAHRAAAQIYWTLDWNAPAAAEEYRRAYELDTGDAVLARQMGDIISDLAGDENIIEGFYQRAIDLDPLSASTYLNLAAYLTFRGHYQEAEAAVYKARAIAPVDAESNSALCTIFVLQGRPEAALAVAEKEVDESARRWELALAYQALGRQRDADAVFADAVRIDGATDPFGIAQLASFRHDREQALAWLERAYQLREFGLLTVNIDPLMKELHRDPAFQSLLRKLRLPDGWSDL